MRLNLEHDGIVSIERFLETPSHIQRPPSSTIFI